MLRVRAIVKKGRLILDEATELPEGAEVELVAADSANDEPEWSAELDAELLRRYRDTTRGPGISGEELVARLRGR